MPWLEKGIEAIEKLMESLRSFILLLASTAFSLVLFEGGFRVVYFLHDQSSLEDQLKRSRDAAPSAAQENVSLAGLIEPSPWKDMVYQLKPRLSVTFQGRPVRTNSFGLRGPETTQEKPAGTIRIAGLGDSIMFGWGVDEGKTYLRLLQEKLRESLHKEVEVLNFGVPGYNTSMEAALLEHRAIAFKPDLILIQFVNNDFDVPAFMFQKENPWDLSRSFLWDFVRERLKRGLSIGEKKLLSIQNFRQRGESELNKVMAEYASMTGSYGCRTAMERIMTIANDQKIPVYVFYGSSTNEQRGLLARLSKRLGFKLFPLSRSVNDYFEKHGLQNTPEERKRLLTVSPTDRHPNDLGHEIIAGALYDLIAPDLQNPQ